MSARSYSEHRRKLNKLVSFGANGEKEFLVCLSKI